jgi:hypothetical protein
MDAIKNKIPGLSEELVPRIDIWGQPVPNKESLIQSGLFAIYAARIATDPVTVEMTKMGMGIAPVPRKIRGIELTDQQWAEFATLAGRMTKDRLDRIIVSPDFERWAPHSRKTVVEEVVRQSREIARNAIMARYPEIPRAAAQIKIEGFRQPGSPPVQPQPQPAITPDRRSEIGPPASGVVNRPRTQQAVNLVPDRNGVEFVYGENGRPSGARIGDRFVRFALHPETGRISGTA